MSPRPTFQCACGDHGWVVLTRGHIALFDPEFAPALGLWNWFAHFDGRNWYAERSHRQNITGSKVVKIKMHMMVMPSPNSMLVDHANRNTLDNRRANLRLVTTSQNAMNQKRRAGTSIYRGVSRTNNGWKAVVGHNGKQTYLGRFASETEAARAYDQAALRLHGQFAVLNFPKSGGVAA